MTPAPSPWSYADIALLLLVFFAAWAVLSFGPHLFILARGFFRAWREGGGE